MFITKRMYTLYGIFRKHPYNKPIYTIVKMSEPKIHVSS